MSSVAELNDLMERFIRGDDRSLLIAGQIEAGLDEHFSDRQPFSDLSLALASFRPGGGPYLYDEAHVLPMMEHALKALQNELDSNVR